jgi:hypothetical protein
LMGAGDTPAATRWRVRVRLAQDYRLMNRNPTNAAVRMSNAAAMVIPHALDDFEPALPTKEDRT